MDFILWSFLVCITLAEVSSEYSMDKAMFEFAMMDRELNHYLEAVQSTINHKPDLTLLAPAITGTTHKAVKVKEERSEKIPDLKLLVEKKFLALQNKNSDADLQNNEKFVQFKQQLKELKKQSVKPKEDGGHNEFDKIKDKDASRAGNERDGLQSDRESDSTEGVDEDMIVTQSQTNFICPITQMEMKKPVKNKVCGHTYDEEAVVRMIESKHKRKKKACCPKIGCSQIDMKMSDLIQDEALRRAIESHNKKRRRQSN
ncbi:E3 SUMO-protein ligase NSE2 isoform X1 [Moschus berezovskii]|uniref:E3 SUMO-protein ligase NSE2 isoform X1 n=1 Tax=Moschus berezovskii TaxID=68408 RepID=UPI002443816A|nr:E3 SUMO-protein ligase NSE2 isoform X1 [Moschus berezovskii]